MPTILLNKLILAMIRISPILTVSIFAAFVCCFVTSVHADSPTVDGTAGDELHWSYQPIRALTPAVDLREDWPLTPIDCFIIENLKRNHVLPSSAAPRDTLIRRAYLDTLGIPPTPAQLSAFQTDDSPDAYARMIDTLLASPHFGERWGRHWMDYARYADSEGYDQDQKRPHAWRWRQWVIDALNSNMAFDQFTIEQLAGDLLPDRTLEHLAATGFQRNTTKNTEAGADPVENHVRETIDRINTLATVWLGTTLKCAQCHDHRYDPFTQREFFQMYAFFNDIVEGEVIAPTQRQLAVFEEMSEVFGKQHDPIADARLEYLERDVPQLAAKWAEELPPRRVAEFVTLMPADIRGGAAEKFDVRDDGSILVSGSLPDRSTYTFRGQTDLSRVTAVRIEMLPDPSLPGGGPGRDSRGAFDLSTISVYELAPGQLGRRVRQLKLANPVASYVSDNGDLDKTIEPSKGYLHGTTSDPAWRIHPRFGERHVAVFELLDPLPCPNGMQLEIVLEQASAEYFCNIGCFRISLTAEATPFHCADITEDVATVLDVSPEDRTPVNVAKLHEYFCSRDPKYQQLTSNYIASLLQAPDDPFATKARVLTDKMPRKKTVIFDRGNFLTPTDQEVTPGTPGILPALSQRRSVADRLDLARWLVAKENPLTPRVTVNRIWMHYFGRGIVESDDDFGAYGSPPTHPELLDWLAAELVRQEWNIKEIHRLILCSRVYQQSSKPRDELAGKDPYNTWLASQNRLQVEAEVVRDIALAAADVLNRKIGGPSVIVQQAGDGDDMAIAHGPRLVPARGPEVLRRGVYIWQQRTAQNPVLSTFDAPETQVTCTRRKRSATPNQALVRLNHPTFFGASIGLANRVVGMVENPYAPADKVLQEQTDALFACALSRAPTSREADAVAQLHAELIEYFHAHPQEAGVISSAMLQKVTDARRIDFAAWVHIARMVLNLQEFIIRE